MGSSTRLGLSYSHEGLLSQLKSGSRENRFLPRRLRLGSGLHLGKVVAPGQSQARTQASINVDVYRVFDERKCQYKLMINGVIVGASARLVHVARSTTFLLDLFTNAHAYCSNPQKVLHTHRVIAPAAFGLVRASYFMRHLCVFGRSPRFNLRDQAACARLRSRQGV